MFRTSTASLLLLASGALAQTTANSPALRPGVTSQRCDSAFVVGPTNCGAAPARTEAAAPVPTAATAPSPPPPGKVVAPPVAASASGQGRGAVSEAEVDAFLANYGKPPREAVRAILDPTDDNIRAYRQRIQREQAVAAYIAQRMGELEKQEAPSATAARDLPALGAMRAVLHVTPNCTECDRAAQLLQQLVASYPTLDARIVYHGVAGRNALLLETARAGITLPASAAETSTQRPPGRLPQIALADLRAGAEGWLAQIRDYIQLREALLAFRRANEAAPAFGVAKPSDNPFRRAADSAGAKEEVK